MNTPSSFLNCPMSCDYHSGPMCVRNLLKLCEEKASISLGVHVGLNHVYGRSGMPPCVRGPLGAAHWSNQPAAATSEMPQ
ncbi:MAG: hypothetical protein NTX35_07225 [Verrucomicrobia bacterium]|nr:hypothetical protein [Verrucomicrobiota bacterium]